MHVHRVPVRAFCSQTFNTTVRLRTGHHGDRDVREPLLLL